MPYTIKYQIDFLNNDENNFSIYLLLKDYTGSISQLTGGPDPFVLSYSSGDDQIINPIRASEAEINFYNDGATPLTEFYSEDDEAWRIDFYFNDPAGAKLLWSGFVVQDSCQETFQDPPHIVSLKATDNLALLKDVPFDEAFIPVTTGHFNQLTWQQNAGNTGDGITSLGLTFQSSTQAPAGFITGNSPLQDLVGFDLATNDDRWIIKNTGTEILDFHATGIISVQFNDSGEDYAWFLQNNIGTSFILVRRTTSAGIRYDFPFDITFSISPGERLFAFGYSYGNNDNSKTYFDSTWSFSVQTGSTSTNILDKLSLFDYIKYSLIKTGLSLPLNIYSNIYENSMGDREDDLGNDMFAQTHLFSGMFLSDDGTWANCYEILEKILFPLNATLQQANGAWQIVRWPELRINTSNAIRGTAYDATLDFTSRTAVTLAPNAPVAIGSNTVFINADATRSILRPYKNVKFTFNYEQPKGLINWNDLKTLGSLISSLPVTIDDINYRYDNYELPPSWEHTHGDTSFIRVVINTSVSPETESERYIVTPGAANEQRGIRFNNIDITKDDVMDFSLRFRMLEEDSNTLRFWIRFILVTPNNQYYLLSDPIGGGSVTWTGPFAVANWDDGFGFYSEVPVGDPKTEYIDWTFSQIAGSEVKPLLFPEDGVLAIEVRGTNGTNTSNRQETIWNDINFTVTNYINKSTQITGQIHNTSIVPNIKNKLEQEINTDDSPRNPIAGTLFTAQLIDFAADIGEIYFIKTKSWHRSGIAETRRLGEITTMEREQMQSVPRTIIEGSIDYTNLLISIMNVLQIDTLLNLNFIFGVTEINFMEGMFKATLWEIHAGEVDAEMAYTFEYIYKTS